MMYHNWVIGLDGASFDLILPWVEAGHLPNFSRILKEGAWGEVKSTYPPITGPAWSTFMTGTNPGKHGVYDWVYRKQGSYAFQPVTGSHILKPSLWQLASQAGKRVLVINVPMTYPPEEVNGLLISGLPATKLYAYPESLAEEIKKNIPDYVVYPDPGVAYSDQGIDTFLVTVEKTIEDQLKLWLDLGLSEKWDFAMTVFSATDVTQHAMWKFMQPDHPLHDPRKAPKYRDAILNVYRRLDQVLGELISLMSKDTVLWLMSDHGFGPLYHFIHVNTWLLKEGLLRIKNNPSAQFKSTCFKLGFSPMPIYERLMQIGLGKLKREVVRGQGQGLLKALFLSFDDVDWKNSVAYSYGNIGQIRINLCGREPEGCVTPGQQYESVIADITQRLGALRDPRTGELVVEAIFRREEIYHGEAADQGPDVFFLPRRLEYFGFGEYEFGDHRIIASLKHGISGTHRMNGIGVAWGVPIRATRLANVGLEDLAPTMLHLMGMPIPAHMDGRVLLEMLSDDCGLPPPVQGPGWESRQAPGSELDQESEAIVRQRLKDLGYVA